MKSAPILPALIERFFTERLMRQRNVSPHTVASYRDTFRLLFAFAQEQLGKSPSKLDLRALDAPFITSFLDHIEQERSASVRTRNLRLTALRSFFNFIAFEEPAYSAHIQRVLTISSKRHDKEQVHFLTRPEIEALLAAPDRSTWIGRRDHALLLLGNGIALVPDRASTGWWQKLAAHADLILFMKKIPFTNSESVHTGAFPIGSTLVAIGKEAVKGLISASQNGLGLLLKPVPATHETTIVAAEAAD